MILGERSPRFLFLSILANVNARPVLNGIDLRMSPFVFGDWGGPKEDMKSGMTPPN